jgi:hypothetical protein
VKRLLLSAFFLAPLFARADAWEPNATFNTTWHDNASNAELSSDRESALETSLNVILSNRYTVSSRDSAEIGFHGQVEWWPRFGGLSMFYGGGSVEWNHKFGLGAQAPEVFVELSADWVGGDEPGRGGSRGAAIFKFRKRFNERWRLALVQEFSELYAKEAVFDSYGALTTLQVDRDISEGVRFTGELFYRNGDVLSYATPPRPDIAAIASERKAVDTFDRPFIAYSLRGTTWGARVSYALALTKDTALVGSYEISRTEKDFLSYRNQLVSVSLVRQF